MSKSVSKASFGFKLAKMGNLIEYTAVLLILIMTFYFQLVLNELPCPLCLLQRLGMMGIIFGFLLNFRFGYYPSHYAIVLLSSLFTAFVAMRQIALHVIPGTGAYGSAFFGLHLYTWSFIAAMLILISTIILMAIDKQYVKDVKESRFSSRWVNALFILALFIITLNIISVTLECGFSACPDNPVTYELLQKI